MKKDSVQSEIQNKLEEWLKDGLADWDITRDKPYFGFNIPGYDDKYFYVWLDAPVGYIASFKNMCDKKNINFDEFWNHESECELYHTLLEKILHIFMHYFGLLCLKLLILDFFLTSNISYLASIPELLSITDVRRRKSAFISLQSL